MVEQQPPRLEFPCDYPIKVMGRSHGDFEQVVLTTVERHAPGFARDRVTLRSSSKSTFAAMTIHITATGRPQLEALHRDLMDTGLVTMVI